MVVVVSALGFLEVADAREAVSSSSALRFRDAVAGVGAGVASGCGLLALPLGAWSLAVGTDAPVLSSPFTGPFLRL